MDGDEYRVIITGELIEGADAESVIAKLATVLKQPHETMMRLFGQRPLPLKTHYSLEEAQKVQKYLKGIGVITRVDALNRNAPLTGTSETADTFEITQFIGRNSERYVKQFEKFQQSGTKSFATTWHWPALFVPFYWAIYRKLWGWSVVIFLSTVLSPLSNVLWALTANYLYFGHVNKRLAHLRKNSSPSDTRRELESITKAGNTSAVALGVAIFLTMATGTITAKTILDNMREKEAQLQREIALTKKRETLLHRNVDMTNDQIPESIVKTAAGRKTYLNMNVLIAGMQMAATGKHKLILPGMNRDQLIKTMRLQQKSFKDGWGKLLSVWVGYEGFSLLSAGPDGEYGNKDDMLMQRKWQRAIK